MDVLFEADLRSRDVMEVLTGQQDRRQAEGEPALNDYTVTLVSGVKSNADRIDELLSTYAVGWSLERMPGVDRAILRMSTYELLFADEIPDAVAISEAVALAQDLSTEESASFVNGLLGRISELKARLSPVVDKPSMDGSAPGEI